jgi:copper chaperone CopZ
MIAASCSVMDAPAGTTLSDQPSRETEMALRSETIQVSGIRCERCVMRLGAALGKVEGLESASANLMGEVSLAWDDERVERPVIIAALERAGFRPLATE